jgi:hypothetical protein
MPAPPLAPRCGWRIVICPKIPQDSSFRYDSLMRNLAVLFIHFIAVLARFRGPGGVRSLVAESLLLKHQILILNRSRKRSPNLHASNRILAGLMALLVRPTRLLRSAIVLKPSTSRLRSFHCHEVRSGSEAILLPPHDYPQNRPRYRFARYTAIISLRSSVRG